MSQPAARQIVLASRPKGTPEPANFRMEEVPLPQMPPKGLLLRVLYLSLDPYRPLGQLLRSDLRQADPVGPRRSRRRGHRPNRKSLK